MPNSIVGVQRLECRGCHVTGPRAKGQVLWGAWEGGSKQSKLVGYDRHQQAVGVRAQGT